MSFLKKILFKLSASLFSDLRSAFVSIMITLVVGGSSGLLFFVESARTATIETLQKPQPLWVSIALALIVILYTYQKTHSLQPPRAKPPKLKWFTYCDMKWKVLISDSDFKVDKVPFCIDHDQQFIVKIAVTSVLELKIEYVRA
ncbi:MAG: hypothetical protein Q8L79_18255 [Methylobacter sp.]|uniref:hypothetical protein n=1 Tax=Methylobacter sp. TaxID=2051955 RepID=UPI0027315F87|nr:hypothetical protein [Methylobacter sp.]MDP1667051.1 hypothetical protein [Methylobacter sp.]